MHKRIQEPQDEGREYQAASEAICECRCKGEELPEDGESATADSVAIDLGVKYDING